MFTSLSASIRSILLRLATFHMTVVFLVASGFSTASASSFLTGDSFSAKDFSGNNGSIRWTDSWQEVSENNGPKKGIVRVVANRKACKNDGCLRIGGAGVKLKGRGLRRTADLSDVSSATLAFSYKRQPLAGLGSGMLVVQASRDGVAWTTLTSIPFSKKKDKHYTEARFDITGLAGPGTQIQILGKSAKAKGYVFLDDVSVEFARAEIPVNLPPNTTADALTTGEDTPATGSVLANDADPEGSVLTARLLAQASHGSVALQANGSYVYTPAKDFFGVDAFTYIASDGLNDSQPTGVTITVKPANDPPIAVADALTSVEDTVARGNVLANDKDVESNALTAKLISQAAHGKVALQANGSYTYTPAKDYSGPDAFTYVANDGSANSQVTTVAITVTPVNDPPNAAGDALSVAEDTSKTGNVLANDTDVENSTLTAKLKSQPAHGTVTLQANGSYTYTPTKDYNGADAFTYVANDGSADSQVATVAITVTPVNDPPNAAGDALSVAEDTSETGNVLANDTDVENSALTAKLKSQPAHGTVTLQVNGSYTYTPAKDYSGTDSFTYVANDGSADSQVATVAITVTPVNDAPVFGAANYPFNLREDSVIGTVAGTASATDVDAGDKLTYAIVTDGANGLFAINADTGAISVKAVPAGKFLVGQTYNLTVGVTDTAGLSAQAPVVITITPADKVADLKVLVIATGTVEEDSALKLMDGLLKQMGIPYDVLDASRAPLTDAILRSTPNHARYNGVILTVTDLSISNGVETGSGFTLTEWQTLHEFERYFGIREAVISGWPTTDMPVLDLNYGMDNSSAITGGSFLGQWQAPAGGMEVFEYVNTANPLSINEWSVAAQPVELYTGVPSQNGNGPTVEPLVVCDPASAVTCTAQYAFVSRLRYNDGREVLLSTISNPWWSTHAQVLAYEFVNFATKGVFLGSRQTYMAAHIDDLFIPDDLWDPVLNVTDETEGAGYRLSEADIQNVAAQQQAFRVNHPLLGNFKLDFPFNGEGVGEYGNPLGAHKDEFAYINHTFSHMDMDATAGMTDPALAQSEIDMNRSLWQSLGLPEYAQNVNIMVTGDHSGIMDDGTVPATPYPQGANLAFLQAAQNAGIRYLASNASQLNQAEEQWVNVNGTQYDLLLLPRYPTNVFYNATHPTTNPLAKGDLLDEYNYIYYDRYFTLYPDLPVGANLCDEGIRTTHPDTAAGICLPLGSPAELFQSEADAALQHMLSYKDWPHFFHIANLANYDGAGKTLVFDWLDAVMERYEQVMKLPVKNLRYYEIGKKTEDRVNARSAVLTGEWNLITNAVSVKSDKPVNITVTGLDVDTSTLCQGGEIYGGQCQLPVELGTTAKTLYINQGLTH